MKIPKKLIVALLSIAVLCTAMLVFILSRKTEKIETPKPGPIPATPIKKPVEIKAETPQRKVLGFSVEKREIESFNFGNGKTLLVFVGGIHGGYEWNSVLLAYEFIDYLKQNPEYISKDIAITIIPSLNPDGVFKIIGKEGRFTLAEVPGGSNEAGRLNANKVDLNRNFDCGWKAAGVWQNKPVSGGTAAFSEPESATFKKFILENIPAAVIFWHSKSGTVYGSSCGKEMLDQTPGMMAAYSKAAGYAAAPTFDQYAVSGDASDWLASINIPAITAELKTHETVEWNQNLAGIKAVINYYESKK